MAASSSTPSWVILATIPRVCAADLPLGADFSLGLSAPPDVNVLTVPPRVSPDPLNCRNFPSVLAADRSGLLLLHATQGERTGTLKFGDLALHATQGEDRSVASRFRRTELLPLDGRRLSAGPQMVAEGEDRSLAPRFRRTELLALSDRALDWRRKRTGGPQMFGDGGFAWRTFVDGYFVCDTLSGTAVRLPEPDGNRIVNAGNLGLITAQDGSGFMVAELQPVVGTDYAALLCFRSNTGRWEQKGIRHPLESRPWGSHGVVSCLGCLWWIDVSWGLLRCDPFDKEPELDFVPLPPLKKLPFRSTLDEDLEMYRCVKFSEGAMRFLEIGVPKKDRVKVSRVSHLVNRHGHRLVPWVTMWTLVNTEAGLWRRKHEISFDEIWSHETFKVAALPKNTVPKIALVDPINSDIVYFFIKSYLVGIDLRTRSVLKYSSYNIENPPSEEMSSRFIRAWEIPRTPQVTHY
ncbi:hypothetical protein EJB05_16209, partial [Eragrostis curvula]